MNDEIAVTMPNDNVSNIRMRTTVTCMKGRLEPIMLKNLPILPSQTSFALSLCTVCNSGIIFTKIVTYYS